MKKSDFFVAHISFLNL